MHPLPYAVLESINHNDYSFRHRGRTHFKKLFKQVQIKDSPNPCGAAGWLEIS